MEVVVVVGVSEVVVDSELVVDTDDVVIAAETVVDVEDVRFVHAESTKNVINAISAVKKRLETLLIICYPPRYIILVFLFYHIIQPFSLDF